MPRKRVLPVFRWCLLLVCVAAVALATAQEGHYWTQHYGTKSMLLSNSVIGGVEDLGAVYYNPARLGMAKGVAFLISADVYEFNRFEITNAFGEKANAEQSDFGGVPSLTAGTFNIKPLKKHTFAYAVLLRQNINVNFSYREERFGELIDELPGEEYFGGGIQLQSKAREQWACLGWAYPVSDRLRVGLTGAASVFEAGKGTAIDLQVLSDAGDVALYRFNRHIDYKRYGMVFKGGLAYSLGTTELGLTVTTPTIGIAGNGSYNFERYYAGIENLGSTSDDYTTNSQSDLPVKRQTPFSLGIGVSTPIRRNMVHASAEWFSGVPEHTILNPGDHYSQSSGDTIRFRLTDRANALINIGLGTEWYIKDKLSMYLSFSTDFSAAPENLTGFTNTQGVAANTTFTANLYHFGGGFVLDLPGADITLGASYTGGRQQIARPINFPDDSDDAIFDPSQTATLDWDRWRLVFSFSVPFLEKKAEDLLKKINPLKD